MGRYDSHKHPFQYRMNQWSAKRINDGIEREAKSIPCHVTKVDKDFIYVAFETQNGIFTPPTVKIPKSNSQYAREPTQVGDKGYAVPGNYYLGGVTGDGGGNTDFYPRGNLTTLSFNGLSHTQNPQRDYDQLTHMGGPNGWIAGPYQKQAQSQQDQQNQQNSQTAMMSLRRTTMFRNEQQKFNSVTTFDATTSGTSDTGQQTGQQQQNQDLTQFSFDKNGKALVQSKDANHNVTVDQQNKTVSMKSSNIIYHDPGSGKIFLGGDGKTGKYCQVGTTCGISINVWARVG